MRKILSVLCLCMIFSMVQNAEVFGVAEILTANESKMEEKFDITMPDDELSQQYLKEYESIKHFQVPAVMLSTLLIASIIGAIVVGGFIEIGINKNKKLIAMALVAISLLGLFGTNRILFKIADTEVMYKASTIKEISDAYAKDTGRLPIQGEYKGAGETNLLFSPDIEEMAKYRLSIANMKINRFFIEEETGKIYYKVERQKFIIPLNKEGESTR